MANLTTAKVNNALKLAGCALRIDTDPRDGVHFFGADDATQCLVAGFSGAVHAGVHRPSHLTLGQWVVAGLRLEAAIRAEADEAAETPEPIACQICGVLTAGALPFALAASVTTIDTCPPCHEQMSARRSLMAHYGNNQPRRLDLKIAALRARAAH